MISLADRLDDDEDDDGSLAGAVKDRLALETRAAPCRSRAWRNWLTIRLVFERALVTFPNAPTDQSLEYTH
jgi:hypothetical protein